MIRTMIDVLAGKLEQVKSSVTSFLWCGEKKKLSSMYIMCHCPDESKFLGWNVCSKARLVSPAVGYSKHLFYPYPFLLFVPISRLFRQLHFHSAPKNVRWHTFGESQKRKKPLLLLDQQVSASGCVPILPSIEDSLYDCHEDQWNTLGRYLGLDVISR